MSPDPGTRTILHVGKAIKEEKSMKANQTVSEMVLESLARQAAALSEGVDRPFEEAFAQVLKTPAGRRLGELVDGPHRHEKAAQWQAGLLAEREAQRPAHLRSFEDGHGTGKGRATRGSGTT